MGLNVRSRLVTAWGWGVQEGKREFPEKTPPGASGSHRSPRLTESCWWAPAPPSQATVGQVSWRMSGLFRPSSAKILAEGPLLSSPTHGAVVPGLLRC